MMKKLPRELPREVVYTFIKIEEGLSGVRGNARCLYFSSPIRLHTWR